MGAYDIITLTVTQISKKVIRYIMHMIVTLLLILILISKTVLKFEF